MAEVDFDAIVAIVGEAGALALAGWKAGQKASGTWEKSPGQIVSPVDIAVNDFLKGALTALLPAAGWLSEETADNADRLSAPLLWVVDPIDGTRDFVRGREGWAVSVALVQNGAPIFGVLAAPACKETWAARAGQGSFCNGRRIIASTRAQYDGARIPIDQLPPGVDLTIVPKPNSIALRMAMVADDRADLVASIRWGYEWDIAAAHLIATEAGARVSDALGQDLRYNSTSGKAFGVLCSAPTIHPAAVHRLAGFAQEVLSAP